jgi:nicotinate phosphoribosyltransferase
VVSWNKKTQQEITMQTEMDINRVYTPSILDNDWYKFLMGNAVFQEYPDAQVKYKFIDRGSTRPDGFKYGVLPYNLQQAIKQMAKLKLEDHELTYLAGYGFPTSYIDFLEDFRYNPEEVVIGESSRGDLEITVSGPWKSAIMWEVPLLALVSELTLEHETNALKKKTGKLIAGYAAAQGAKATFMGDCKFSEFGTRRRRSFEVQEAVVREFRGHANCVGTSNVYLAKKYNMAPMGTVAHEWYMGVSALEGLSHANKHALRIWLKHLPNGLPKLALPDTFSTEVFLLDFDKQLANEYDSVRQDSGDPRSFANKILNHYRKWNVDPKTKGIVFSDGLDAGQAVVLYDLYKNSFKSVSVGIGTNFTNDFVPFGGTKAMNIVMKLSEVNGVPVVKISDVDTKATGDPEAVKVAKWTFAKRLGQKRDL